MRWRVLHSILPRLLFATVIVAAQLALPEIAKSQDHPKKVLVLYSLRHDGEFSREGETALPRLLDDGLNGNLDYYSEFIDRARSSNPSYRAAFRDFLRVKYSGVRFNLVIAMQDNAAEFVAENRDGLFSRTPIVVLANDAGWTRISNSTGLINPRNFAGTLIFLRRLQPDVKNVFVVTGASSADKAYENAVRRQLPAFSSALNVIYFSGLATPELRKRLSRLPEHSAVYYVLVNQDGLGDKYHPLEYADRVTAAANAPTYCWVASAMGHGILGGSLYVQKSVIEQVGKLALRVLRGEDPGHIPVSYFSSNVTQVDWRELRRWGIDESRIPAGTLVRFRNPTVWDQYGNYIIATAAVLLTQTMLIVGLLLQRRQRRRAENQLRGNQRELGKSYERVRDLGTRLLQAQEIERSQIARELHDDICQQMLLLMIELEFLKRSDPSREEARAALSMAQDVSRNLQELSHRLHPAKLQLVGLIAALDQLCRDVSRAGLVVKFTHENVPSTLAPDATLCLFRIVQESLGNAIKYSGASEVSVRLAARPAGLSLDIIDNGKGFDVDAAWNKGLGLVSMTERLEAMGGLLEISSKAGVGTSIAARIPGQYCAPIPTSVAV